MSLKVIEVVVDAGLRDSVAGIADHHKALDFWTSPPGDDGRCSVRVLVRPEQRQAVMDALQSLLDPTGGARLVIHSTEAVWPQPDSDDEDTPARGVQTTREELYSQIERGARLDSTFFLLVTLSTVVAAIGLLRDNVAVLIGAMVIAPLLGPNLALALGAALGDSALMGRALVANLAGMVVAFSLSLVIGFLWPPGALADSVELAARADVGLDGVGLALASGAAAVLSLTTGLPSVLVGVMVAVALLPPTAAMGLLVGAADFSSAAGAALLLAVNIVCVNLSANVVLLVKGIRPRTWLEKRRARQSMKLNLVVWAVSLTVLVTAIYVRQRVLET